MKVLLIENNSDEARHFREILESNPVDRFGLHYVDNLEQAEQYLSLVHPDLLVVDVDNFVDDLETMKSFVRAWRKDLPILTIGVEAQKGHSTRYPWDCGQDFIVKEQISYFSLKKSIQSVVDRYNTAIRRREELITVCSYCDDIRDGKDSWKSANVDITRNPFISISHGICPKCAQFHFPQIFGSRENIAG